MQRKEEEGKKEAILDLCLSVHPGPAHSFIYPSIQASRAAAPFLLRSMREKCELHSHMHLPTYTCTPY